MNVDVEVTAGTGYSWIFTNSVIVIVINFIRTGKISRLRKVWDTQLRINFIITLPVYNFINPAESELDVMLKYFRRLNLL